VSSLKAAADNLLAAEAEKLARWEGELEEHRGKTSSLTKTAQAAIDQARAEIERLHAKAAAKLKAEYTGLITALDAAEEENKAQARSLESLLGTSLGDVQQWLLRVNRAKVFGGSAEEKLKVVEEVAPHVSSFNADLPNLTQSLCSFKRAWKTYIGRLDQHSQTVGREEAISPSLSSSPRVSSSLSFSSLPRVSGSPSEGVWWFKNEFSTFTPYVKESSDQVEQEYARRSPKAQVGNYEVDFRAMQQTNLKTGYVRKVQRMPIPSWTWRHESSEFRPYSVSDCFLLEQAHSLQKGTLRLTIRGLKYKVDFASMTQTNRSTGVARMIKRT
jgi:hypothetical protein